MKRTTVFLDDDLLRSLKRYAARNGMSLAGVVREAASAYLSAPKPAATIPSVAGRFESGHTDTATRADDLLWNSPHE